MQASATGAQYVRERVAGSGSGAMAKGQIVQGHISHAEFSNCVCGSTEALLWCLG